MLQTLKGVINSSFRVTLESKSSLLREPEKRKSIEMDAKIGKFFDSVGSFFSGGDKIPWSEGDVIAVSSRKTNLWVKMDSQADFTDIRAVLGVIF